MIAITGATGNIGSKLAQILLDKGSEVLCIARNAGRLIQFTDIGAQAAAISLAQTELLAEALSKAEAVFAMIPPNYQAPDFLAYQEMIGKSLVSAIDQAGVKRVVNLSSLGAHLPDKTGPIKGLHAQEQRLNELIDVDVLHLRPTYFMENLLANLELIKTRSIMGSAIRGDIQLPMIATQDIAAAAAEHLLSQDFSGKSIAHLLGERDLSLDEAARIIGRKIDIPDLRYIQFSYEDTEKAMTSMGFSASAAELFTEMAKAFNEGLIEATRTKKNTTATSIEEFVQIFPTMLYG